MSKTVTLEVPDEVFAVLQQEAIRTGRPLPELVSEWVVRMAPTPRPNLTEEERRAARQRLLRHAGAVDSGDPNSGDNARIDADLTTAYGADHPEPH
jgi:hypothetical protein